MNRVRMFGPLGASSGYGNAAKGFAEAFSQSDIPTKFQFGKEAEITYQEFMDSLRKYNGDTNVDFYLHGPPWSKHKSQAYKIGYFYWEADRLPINWERMINQVDELWVPCGLVETACRRAKFRGPIKVVPTPGRAWEHDQRIVIPSDFSDNFVVSEDVFKFYSIFQWHERKGYKELLKAYFTTFTERDKVLLILKVNPLNVGQYTKPNIKRDILDIKRRLNQKYYPKLFLSSDILDPIYLQALHNTGDCYVAAHRGEGWGVPIHDAMMAQNHLIVTRFGGITEHLDSNSAHIIEHKIGPVSGMDWSPLYGDYQNWAYPSIRSISQNMQEVFKNPKRHSDKALRAKEIADQMSVQAVAKIISKELSNLRKR